MIVLIILITVFLCLSYYGQPCFFCKSPACLDPPPNLHPNQRPKTNKCSTFGSGTEEFLHLGFVGGSWFISATFYESFRK